MTTIKQKKTSVLLHFDLLHGIDEINDVDKITSTELTDKHHDPELFKSIKTEIIHDLRRILYLVILYSKLKRYPPYFLLVTQTNNSDYFFYCRFKQGKMGR